MNKKDKVIMEFPVLHEAWKCDSRGWVMERKNGTRYLKLTIHGSEYEADPHELFDRIKEYERVIELTNIALEELA